jgi:transcription elongation factor GreA
MSLAILATEDNWQGFDEAWTRLIESGGSIDELLGAIEIVGSKRRISRCVTMVREHADSLHKAGRSADAALVLGAAVRAGGAVNELAEPLLRHAEAAWSHETWWSSFCELADLRRETPDLRKAWTFFDDMRSYDVGVVVFHAAGWGVGEVTELAHAALEVAINFQSGRKDRFPLRTAVEIFERLPQHDLRAQLLRDPAGLKKRLKDEPLEILKAVLLRYGGKASNVTVRNALMQIGVDGNAWSSWWKRTRLLAENSEWFKVSGNAARADLELLRRAVDPVDAMRRQLMHAPNLKDALSRVRDLLAGAKLDEPIRKVALEVIEQLSTDKTQPLEQRLAGWMLLREHRGETPAPLADRLRDAAAQPAPGDPSVPPPLWALLARIPGTREQEKSFELLREVYGERWAEEGIQHLAHASPGMVAPLIDGLRAAGRDEELARHYANLLARPLRAPFVLIALARLAERGELTGNYPTPVQRAMALIELAVFLNESKRGNALMTRAQARLTELLAKEPNPLLRSMLKDVDVPSLRSIRGMLQRGVDDKIDGLITDIAIETGGDVFGAEQIPFWKEEKIWTTRGGLERRDGELREIREKKIPANAEAIGRAAAYGDLSENSEWENAIEEQRQLTDQAATIDRELRMAALLENANIPDNVVCPGTRVTYRELASGEVHSVNLLGPWDSYRDHTVSYRAPLAQGMLGKRPGDRVTIELPSGVLEVQVQAVELAPL